MRTRLLRLTLRSPLHPTVSRRFMLLTGLAGAAVIPAVPLRYATHEDSHIVLGSTNATWWRGVTPSSPSTPSPQGATHATVRFKGHLTEMTAQLARGEELDQAILRYLQKYPGEWKALGVEAAATEDDLQQAARGSAVVLFQPV
ncbi:MAG: hypothetical protein ACR2HR_10585 [Euzebya sp.]